MTVRSAVKIGPQDQGRAMPLRTFEFAEVETGHVYELARGYVVVSEVPSYFHACLVVILRNALIQYQLANPGRIHMILGAMECKLLVPELSSERHPDLAVYLKRPQGARNRSLWRTWIPELVIEVVSPDSVDRDYVEKRDEYWTLGVKEYWIVDARLQRVTVLKRGRSRWSENHLTAGATCETRLLPGFTLSCQKIFDAANDAE